MNELAAWWEDVRYFVRLMVVGLIAEYARRKMPPKQEDEDE